MMISTKGRYALRVLVDMAEHQGEGYIPLKEIAARQGLSLLELAYAWCCFHPGVDTMILGASSLEQLAQNLETVERLSALPQEVQAQCDQVWKGLSQDRFPYFY